MEIYNEVLNDYNLLSRDERINIFGNCSPIKRKDSKSVVFKEIPINIKQHNNNGGVV